MAGIIRFSKAGSIRRMRETIKDLDFIISTDDPDDSQGSASCIIGH